MKLFLALMLCFYITLKLVEGFHKFLIQFLPCEIESQLENSNFSFFTDFIRIRYVVLRNFNLQS